MHGFSTLKTVQNGKVQKEQKEQVAQNGLFRRRKSVQFTAFFQKTATFKQLRVE